MKFPIYPYRLNKPQKLDEMLAIVEVLAEDFDNIRVDLYLVDSEIYVGELTNNHGAGREAFLPEPRLNYVQAPLFVDPEADPLHLLKQAPFLPRVV